MKDRIEVFARENLKGMLADIREIVAIRSVKGEPEPGMPYGRSLAEAVACMQGIARRHGFEAINHDNYMLTLTLNNKPDELGILCHLDVVHEGKGWTTPPYETDIRGGRIYGRGTADNKGPAIAALYAMKCVRELGVPLTKNARLMLGTDEECGSSDLKEYFKREAPPPYCFSPDAAFPVCNIEKGRFAPSFSAAYPEDAALPRILSIEGGYAVNVVPGSGQAVIEGMDEGVLRTCLARCAEETGVSFTTTGEGSQIAIQAEGVSAHASRPEEGNNALTALLTLLVSLPFADSEGFRRLRALSALLPHKDYLGEAAGVKMEDQLSGPLTCSLNILKYSPTDLTGKFDCRCPLCSNEENTSMVMARKFTEAGIFLSSTDMVRPHHVPEELPFIQTLLRAYEMYTSEKGKCVSMGGGTYVHGIENGVAFGAAFPETETFAHAPDECAVIAELEACVKIFAQIIIDMCQ